ncbi:MAG: NAD(P)-dependent oxidoreductase [Eubacteriales bacterium]|nr:NAD(P)-dependent oxidoreductase [Eubacteriales bacterium]
MSKPKALVTAAFNKEGIDYLRKRYDVTYCSWMDRGKQYTEEELLPMVKDKELIVMETDPFSKQVADAAKNLKVLACCRGMKGNDGTIDLDTLNARKIPVLFAPGRNTNAVAEHTILMTLALLKKVKATTTWLYSNQWKNWLDFYLTFRTAEIRGKTIGLMGFGQIGQRVSELFNAFDAHVIAYDAYLTDPSIYEKKKVQMVDKETLFKSSDVVSLHMNVSDTNKGCVGREELSLMKPTAYIVNCSRAVLIDHDALLDAIKEKKIAGVGMDVFYKEPCTTENEPLLAFESVFAMPHMGGSTNDVIDNQSKMVIHDLNALEEHKQPQYILNPEVLK